MVPSPQLSVLYDVRQMQSQSMCGYQSELPGITTLTSLLEPVWTHRTLGINHFSIILFINSSLPPVCYVSHVMCHVSHVICHISCVMGHSSCVLCKKNYIFSSSSSTNWLSQSVEGLLPTGSTLFSLIKSHLKL